MTGGVEANYVTLRAASTVWDDAADGLDGAWHRLYGTSGSPMDDGVAQAFELFRDSWVDEVKRIATKAQTYSENLSDAVKSYATVDAGAYERIRAILPFDYRNSTLDPGGAPPPTPTPTPGPSPTPPSDSSPSPAPAPPSPSPGPTPTPSPTP